MPSIESCNIHIKEIKYINVDGSVLEKIICVVYWAYKNLFAKRSTNELRN